MTRKIEIYPLNRVEGDLEITIELEDNIVIDARSAGTMYRGFENIMVGRALLDGLVITPRICGVCSTSHLNAAASALDMIYNVDVPRQAIWIRSITAMAEMLQNDIRHAFLLFMPDFTEVAYQKEPLYAEMLKRYTPLKGSSQRQAIDESRRILEIIAILGGQWPHSSFMVPGGVVSMPSTNELNRCTYLLNNFKQWYETRYWAAASKGGMLFRRKPSWLPGSRKVNPILKSDLGMYIRFATKMGLHRMGRGHGNFISFGIPGLETEPDDQQKARQTPPTAGGFYSENRLLPVDQENITEDVSHSWFAGSGKNHHPYNGQSSPVCHGE